MGIKLRNYQKFTFLYTSFLLVVPFLISCKNCISLQKLILETLMVFYLIFTFNFVYELLQNFYINAVNKIKKILLWTWPWFLLTKLEVVTSQPLYYNNYKSKYCERKELFFQYLLKYKKMLLLIRGRFVFKGQVWKGIGETRKRSCHMSGNCTVWLIILPLYY